MKSRTLVAAAAVVVCTLLAGCATSSTSAGGDDTADSGGPVSLRFQSLAFQDTTIAATQQIVEDWNSANPDIQVELVQGSWDSVHDQLVTQFQGGTAPDIIHDESADIAQFARQGYLADLAPLLSEGTTSSIDAGVLETVTVDGKVIAAPTLLQSYVVFGNTKLLEAAGVSVPTGDSWSWDEFAAAAKQASTGGTPGLGWGLKQPTATVMSMGLNFDGTFFSTADGATSITVDDAELEVPKRIHDMAYTDNSLDRTSLTQGGADVLTAFMAGGYAMTVGGNYAAQQLKEQGPEGFEWTVLPTLTGSSSDQAANPQTLSVSAQSSHVAESAKFIDFFMQADNLAAVAEGDWLIPTSSSARDVVATSTGGADGWDQTLASGDTLTRAPFQSVDTYPQWKDQIATPALQQYFGDEISLTDLARQLTDGWAQVGGR